MQRTPPAAKLEIQFAFLRSKLSGELVSVQPTGHLSDVGNGGGHCNDADTAPFFLEKSCHGEQSLERVPSRAIADHVAFVNNKRGESTERSLFDELSEDEESLFDGNNHDVCVFNRRSGATRQRDAVKLLFANLDVAKLVRKPFGLFISKTYKWHNKNSELARRFCDESSGDRDCC